jgi:hypothetical protein
MPANYSLQVEYKLRDGTHFWTGRDRLTSGVMVGNKDFEASLADLKKQLKESLRANGEGGTPVCTQSDAELAVHTAKTGHCMTLWNVDTFFN